MNIRKLISTMIYAGFFPVASILIFFINLYRPVKITVLHLARIGHQALNTELITRRARLGMYGKNPIVIFLSEHRAIANTALYKLQKRNLLLVDDVICRRFLFSLVRFKSRYFLNEPMNSNEYIEFHNAPPSLKFSLEERQYGENILSGFGITDKDWIVSIFARDSAFLAQYNPSGDHSYHNYRDADINAYVAAVKFIIDQGGWVVRTGSVVTKPMDFKHEHFIDYPYCDQRSEFMDIYLMWRSKFVLANTSGIGDVAKIFDTPFCGVNHMPIDHAPWGKNNIYIPKKLKRKNNDSWYSLNDYYKLLESKDLDGAEKNCYLHSNFYETEDIEIVDNSTEEILEITKEMLERLEGNFNENSEESENQLRYQKVHTLSHIFYPVLTPIGRDFLKKNPWFLKD